MIKDLLKLFDGDLSKHLVTSLTGEVSESNKREADTFTNYEIVNEELWKNHLAGKKRIGVFPIKDKKVKWGCIDIDPRNYADYSSKKYLDIIKKYNLPLIAIKSKSGGLHLFLFFKDWTDREKASEILDTWNNKYFGSAEVFPTQDKGVNMPYFKMDATLEHAFDENGNGLLIGAFIELAKTKLCTYDNLKNIKVDSPEDESLYSEYPPCVQNLMREKWSGNHRNDMLFNVAVLKYKEHDGKISKVDMRSHLIEKNKEYFTNPMPDNEVEATVLKSISKPQDYFYKCPPRYNGLVPICDKEQCKLRKLGLNQQAPDIINEFESVEFTQDLKGMLYSFKFRGQQITVSPEDMVDEKSWKKKLLNYKIYWMNLPRPRSGPNPFELMMRSLVEMASENTSMLFEDTVEEQQYKILKEFFENHIEEDSLEKLNDGYVHIDDTNHCYFKKSTLQDFLDRRKKIFNSTQEAMRFLKCERLDYFEGIKNIWKVQLPKFVEYAKPKKKTNKQDNAISEFDNEYHTNKFRTSETKKPKTQND